MRPADRMPTVGAGIIVQQDFALDELFLLLDRKALFVRRWRMLSETSSQKDEMEARVTLERLWQRTRAQGLWKPAAVARFLLARLAKEGLSLSADEPGGAECALGFSPGLLGRLRRRWADSRFVVALQLVTAGRRAAEHSAELGRSGNVSEQFLVHGLAAELAEALAGCNQNRVERLAGWKLSIRHSPGYPVWPELAEQKKLFRLLEPGRIGVTLTESYEIVPEYSTSAIILPEK